MYGVSSDGSLPGSVHAAWHSVGSAKDSYEGLWADDVDFRDISNATLDYHQQTFWSNWSTFGNNRGFGTDYGALSERGGWPLNSLLEADRMGDAKKNVEHITFNSTDMNFAPFGPNAGNTLWNYPVLTKLSPWDIIRETDATDKGNAPSVGNGVTEDLNLVEYVLFLKNARIMAGVDDALYASNNLVLIPRLPWGWTSLTINNWPVTYRNGSSFARTTVSYSVQVQPTQVTMQVSAAASIRGVRIRLGPFDPTAVGTTVTVNGSRVTFTQQVRGDASWLWTTQNIGTNALHVVATVNAPLQQAFYSFDTDSLSGFIRNGGTWSTTAGHVVAQVGANDGWNINRNTLTNGSVSADVKLDSGHAVGIALRSSSDGTQGYALILDQVDGLIKLARYPYTVLTSASINVNFQRTYNLRLDGVGANLVAFLNGVQVFTANDSTYSSGHYGLYAYNSIGEFDNLLIKTSPLLEQTFTGTSLSNWTANGGSWSNPGGLANVSTTGDAWNISTSTGTNFIYSANVRLVSGNAVGISVRTSNGGSQGYDLILDQVDGGIKFAIRPHVRLAFAPFTIVNNQIYNLRIVANGSTLQGYVDGQLLLTVTDTTYTTGNFGLYAYSSTAKFDDVRAVAQYRVPKKVE